MSGNNKRIRAHVALCTVAYLLERAVEIEAKQPVELNFEGHTVWETSTLSPDARRVLGSLKISTPPRIVAGPST